MQNSKLINFTDLSLEEKTMVLEWRNHPYIRKWMYNSQEISLEEHLKFILSLKNSDDKFYFLVKNKNKYIGVVDLTSINNIEKKAELGLYAKPNLKGVGKELIQTIIDYAFNTYGLKYLDANAYIQNTHAIKLYEYFNFKEYHRDNKIIYMELKNENR